MSIKGVPAPALPMDLAHYAPFYWTAISNRWTANSSRQYHARFGIGVVEWRILATLGELGTATSLDAAHLAVLDRGAASRSMNRLLEKALIAPVPGRFVGRAKPYAMTAAGVSLFNEISAMARSRADAFMADLAAEERDLFVQLLRRVYEQSALLPEISVVPAEQDP